MQNNKIPVVAIKALMIALSCNIASSDFINNHLGVSTFISPGPGALLDEFLVGNDQIDTGDQERVNGDLSGNGRAIAELQGAIMR